MTTTRSVRFDAPLVKPAFDTINEGKRPDDRTLRGAIRELRKARGYVFRRGVRSEENDGILKQFDDMIDVLKFCLRQPVDTEIRLCSRCEKREPRMGDLCKRCADETGTRPRGKV